MDGEEMIRLCGSSWQYCNGKCSKCSIAVLPVYSTITKVITEPLDKKEFEENIARCAERNVVAALQTKSSEKDVHIMPENTTLETKEAGKHE